MPPVKKVLLISYYACMPGACQAEWLDDKLDSLLKADIDVVLISAICAQRHENPQVTHWRIPSISLTDFRDEWMRIRQRSERIPFICYFILPFALTIGSLLDGIQYIFTKGIGEGRWSWIFSSFIGALFATLKFKPNVVLTTGGPASAHIAGIAIGRLTSSPIIVELQDPLSGGDIGRNKQARSWLYRIETLIVKNATKTVYVTKSAALFASKQFESHSIFGIYPGARDFKINSSSGPSNPVGKLRIIHLGSLYATRTFRPIILAIDKLISSGKLSSSGVELINLGHVSREIYEEIKLKSYVKIFAPIAREDALKFAANCNVTLLIQNDDERSKVTIPYKTYDYLNLGNRVLALVNSDELMEMIRYYGQVAVDIKDIDAIVDHLTNLIECRLENQSAEIKIDPIKQVCELLALPN